MNSTPSAERLHIAFFGRRNAGKSSLVNAVTSQQLSIVSDVAGTTTDPVTKTMELLPLGPVVIIDTPGIDDCGKIGELRVEKTKQILNKTDIAVLVVDINGGINDIDKELIRIFAERNIDFVVAFSKNDVNNASDEFFNTQNNVINDIVNKTEGKARFKTICVSSVNNTNIYELKELIGSFNKELHDKRFIADFIKEKDIVLFVTPIDEAAPKGRLILPQQQAIRDVLDANGISIVVQEDEIKDALMSLNKKPKLVVTDSQAFKRVSKEVPEDIYLTSFSILMARYKGQLDVAVKGVNGLETLKDNDKVLISEGCTHHRQCNDIGTVKLPTWINNYTNKKLVYEFTSGGEFKEDLSDYKLVVHCGGCMLNDRQMRYRQQVAINNGVLFTNYGILIAKINGILDRSIAIVRDNS